MKCFKLLFLIFSITCTAVTIESCSSDPCDDISCLNGGTCMDGDCKCPNGFSGTTCQNEDKCITQNLQCQNGGTCVSGSCDCPDGFSGSLCENIDLTKLQALLDNGKTPAELLAAGATVSDFYGKSYKEGYIFYINAADGKGLVAATTDQDGEGTGAAWGCTGTDISGVGNAGNTGGKPDDVSGTRIGDGKANTDAILMDCSSSSNAAQLCRNKGAEWFLPSIQELKLMHDNLYEKGFGDLAEDYFNTGEYYSSSEEDSDFAWGYRFSNNDDYSLHFKTGKFNVRAAKAF